MNLPNPDMNFTALNPLPASDLNDMVENIEALADFFGEPDNDWTGVGAAPNTVTANGNRSYDLVFNAVNLSTFISPSMRLRTTRTVAAPTQCTSLNGTTQYYSKSSPNKLTFTDDFVVSAWVKLSSYTNSMIASRYNGTSGWYMYITSAGRVEMTGHNAGSGNASFVTSYQSIPLNKWVHITGQLDMSSFTATTTTSYIMIDGVDIPAVVTRIGTNPVALVQAGNLEIGSYNGGTLPFNGKLAQVAIFSAKVTQATMRTYMSQGLAGTETSLVSAYSFNNSIADLNTTTPNDLTAQGSAVATAADSPFGGQADGTISSTLDYAIVQKVAFSTNTTVTVQVPQGCTIPTSGGVASVSYSGLKAPFGMPVQQDKWELSLPILANLSATAGATANTYYRTYLDITVPIGAWWVGYDVTTQTSATATATADSIFTVSTTTSSTTDIVLTSWSYHATTTANVFHIDSSSRSALFSYSTATPLYGLIKTSVVSNTGLAIRGDSSSCRLYIRNAYL